jgi:hypothetical protein
MKDEELDDLLKGLDLPDDESAKLQYRASKGGQIGGRVSGKNNVKSGHLRKIASLGGKKQKGNSNVAKWSKDNPELHKEYAIKAGKLGGIKSKELGLGIHGLSAEERKKIHPPTKPILVFKDDVLVKEYNSISECGRDMNLDKGNIHKVLKGIYKQHKGYTFKFKI